MLYSASMDMQGKPPHGSERCYQLPPALESSPPMLLSLTPCWLRAPESPGPWS